jgi:hypothetical protein
MQTGQSFDEIMRWIREELDAERAWNQPPSSISYMAGAHVAAALRRAMHPLQAVVKYFRKQRER